MDGFKIRLLALLLCFEVGLGEDDYSIYDYEQTDISGDKYLGRGRVYLNNKEGMCALYPTTNVSNGTVVQFRLQCHIRELAEWDRWSPTGLARLMEEWKTGNQRMYARYGESRPPTWMYTGEIGHPVFLTRSSTLTITEILLEDTRLLPYCRPPAEAVPPAVLTISSFNHPLLHGLERLTVDSCHLRSVKWDNFAFSNLRFLSLSSYISLFDGGSTQLEVPVSPKLEQVIISHLLPNGSWSLSKDPFKGLSSLVRLSVVRNRQLGILPAALFSSCSNLEYLNLEHNGLREILPNTWTNPDGNKCLGNLKALNLAQNELQQLPPGSFASLPNLTILKLRHNRLTTLEPGVFTDLPNLESLELDDNNLTYLGNRIFSNLTLLKTLEIQYNKLEWLEDETFLGNAELKSLRLDRNRLKIFPLALWHLTGLQSLRLESNAIVSLTLPKGKERLEQLLYLYLDDNKIEEISEEFLSHFPSLVVLRLGQNHLLQLDPNTFQGNPQLEMLMLQRNQLESIPESLFPSGAFLHLSHLDLRQNPRLNITGGLLCSSLPPPQNVLLDGSAFITPCPLETIPPLDTNVTVPQEKN